jgi:hypothetical protein
VGQLRIVDNFCRKNSSKALGFRPKLTFKQSNSQKPPQQLKENEENAVINLNASYKKEEFFILQRQEIWSSNAKRREVRNSKGQYEENTSFEKNLKMNAGDGQIWSGITLPSWRHPRIEKPLK